MATFVELVGLNIQHRVVVSTSAIYRVRPALPSEAPNAVKVEFGGERLYTKEPLAPLVARLIEAECDLIRFTHIDGEAVYLNKKSIAQFQPALLDIDSVAAKTVFFVSGKRQAVTEEYGAIKTLFNVKQLPT